MSSTAVHTGKRRRSDRTPRYAEGEGARIEATVVVSMAVISALNYAYTLILVWLLPQPEFAIVGSASALLLVCGTVSQASAPWVLSREVVRARHDPARRRAAVTFAVVITAVQACVAGGVTSAIAVQYSSGLTTAIVFGAVVTIFSGSTVCGYLQGLQRFRLIAMTRVAEVVVKIGAGAALVALGAGAGGALAGFAFGALVVTVVGVLYMAPDIRFENWWQHDAALWQAAGGLTAIQGAVAVLASLDVAVGSLMLTDRSALATYQAAQIVTRIPVFIATGLSLIAFPRLSLAPDRLGDSMRRTLGLFIRVAGPVVAVTATLPSAVVGHMFPHDYSGITRLLAWGAVGGALMGLINLVTTFFQARDVYARPTRILAMGVVLQLGLVIGGIQYDGNLGLVAFVAIGAAVVAIALLADARRRWPGCLAGTGRPLLLVAVLAAPLVPLRHWPVLWTVWMVGGAAGPALSALLRFRHTGDPTETAVDDRLVRLEPSEADDGARP